MITIEDMVQREIHRIATRSTTPALNACLTKGSLTRFALLGDCAGCRASIPTRSRPPSPIAILRDVVCELSGKPQIADWNDGEEFEKAHKRVIRAYDRAIKKAMA